MQIPVVIFSMKLAKVFKIIALILIGIVIVFLFIEITFKINNKYRISGMTYDGKLGWRLKKNLFIKKLKDNSNEIYYFSTNNSGFRDRRHRFFKKIDTKRIIILGDSYTVGGYVSDEEVFVRLFEKILKEKKGDSAKYDVMNVAVSAWATDQQFLYLKQEGMKYEPNYIFLMIAPNDIRESYVKRFFYLDSKGSLKRNPMSPIHWKKRFFWFLSNSFCSYQFLQQKVFNSNYGTFGDIFRHFPVGWEIEGSDSGDHALFLKKAPGKVKEAYGLFRTLLLKMNGLCIKNNCKLILVVLPTKMEFGIESNLYEPGKVGKYVRDIALENDILFLDLFPLLASEEDPLDAFISDEYHFDREGHSFIAKMLYEFFYSKDL